jgi:predicted metal-dependent hydrolase
MIAWYTTRGQLWIERRLAHYAVQLGVAPTAVRVRDMGQRWGSCSARGRVNFHWRILVFPPSIIDYVIVHELAHLRELNHSRAFWGLVETILPDYRRRKTWLATEGHAAP